MKLGIFKRSRAVTAKKCAKKRDVLLNKPIAFQSFYSCYTEFNSTSIQRGGWINGRGTKLSLLSPPVFFSPFRRGNLFSFSWVSFLSLSPFYTYQLISFGNT